MIIQYNHYCVCSCVLYAKTHLIRIDKRSEDSECEQIDIDSNIVLFKIDSKTEALPYINRLTKNGYTDLY